jgi:hypothetical protein
MIEFKDPEHLIEVLKFAAENGCTMRLVEQFDYLTKYGEGDNICEVYGDWVPNSFTFLMKHPDGRRWFNGGIIYSGPGQPLNGSGPAFAVSLEKTGHEHNWSVHT